MDSTGVGTKKREGGLCEGRLKDPSSTGRATGTEYEKLMEWGGRTQRGKRTLQKTKLMGVGGRRGGPVEDGQAGGFGRVHEEGGDNGRGAREGKGERGSG